MVGLRIPTAPKLQRSGVVWGMFIRPSARGTGLAKALLGHVIDHAGSRVEALRLAVVTSNTAAVRLYHGAGFRQYGLDRRALRLGDDYYDEYLMALKFRRRAAEKSRVVPPLDPAAPGRGSPS